MALVTTCAGVTVPVQLDTLTCEEKIDDTSTSTAFTVLDATGLSLSQYQVVQITDTVTSTLLYAGYIDNVSDTPLGPGNTSTLVRVVTCKDSRWLADKGTWTGPEFNGWLAGDVAAEIHRVSLAAEGVTASYALRHDMDATSFGAGTLVGTTAASGALTLAAAGTDFTQLESTTANFNTGTLTNVLGASNALVLQSYPVIKFSGTAGAALDNNNLYTYYKIWAGSYTFVSQDLIYYDMWVASSSPEIKAGLDLQFSDGTWLHDQVSAFQDAQTITLNPAQDLKGWADDQWYSRVCVVPSTMAGKVVVAAYVVFEGNKGGQYLAYFKNCKVMDPTGVTVRISIFEGATTKLHTQTKGSSNGYFNVMISTTTAYAHDGNRISPQRSITSVGIVKGSVISWAERDVVQLPGGNNTYLPQVKVEISYDDAATWNTCTNHAPLPGLLVGMNTSGRNIAIRQTLAVGGPSPEMAPILLDCSFTVFSAAAATKTDFVDIRTSQTQLAAGVLTNATSYTGVGIQTTGFYKTWDDGNLGTYFILGLGTAPSYGIQENYAYNRGDSGNEIRVRLDDAGNWANFIAELDVHIVTSTGQYGLEYRTTSFVSGNNRYAYAVKLAPTSLSVDRGTNGGADSRVTIGSVALTLTVDAWYRLKVAVTGSTHKIFLNDVLFLTITDGNFTAAGNFLLWTYDGATGRHSGHYDNFGVIGYDASFTGISTWVTPSTSLSGIVGSSQINFNVIVPPSSILLVESTIDGGTTWNTCTDGQTIPLLIPGFNAAGKNLKFRYTMTNQSINQPIVIQAHSMFVIGQYNASGTRVSPVLALDNAGTVGSSGVTWTALTPPGTAVAVASSTDNITYTPLAASGNPIAGLVAQGVMTEDDFDANSAANYTALFWTGGAAPVFTINTALSRMEVTSGTNAILAWNTAQFPSCKDVSLEVITNQADTGGLVWRYTSVDNCYYVTLHDNSAGSNPNTLTLRKRVAGVDSQLVAPTTLPVTFTRGTYHTLKVTMIGQIITAFFDGLQVFTFSDASLVGPGQVGLRQSSSTTSYWYSLRAQQLGQSAVGAVAYTKQTLTSSDPTQNPVLSQLVTSVRGPDLMSGVLINATNYRYKNSPAACLSDAAQQSKYYWKIDKNKHLSMQDRSYSPAPWPLYSADQSLMISSSYPQAIRQSPLYRNRQYVYNCVDIQTVPEQKIGDGNTQSWVLAYPVDSIVSLSLDGSPQTWGIQGAVTGKNFYYKQGTNILAADTSLFPEFGAVIAISYVAQVPYVAMKESTAQQAIIAAIDSTTGIISSSLDGQGISRAAGDVLAQANIDAYAQLSVDWEYTTHRSGLSAGHYQSMFVPEFGLNDLDMLITDIVVKPWQDATGTINYDYDVKATSGPNISSWQKIFA